MGKGRFKSDDGDEFVETLQKYVPVEDDAGWVPRRADMLICLKTELELHPNKMDNFLGKIFNFSKFS